jgi:hypothetical protein
MMKKKKKAEDSSSSSEENSLLGAEIIPEDLKLTEKVVLKIKSAITPSTLA